MAQRSRFSGPTAPPPDVVSATARPGCGSHDLSRGPRQAGRGALRQAPALPDRGAAVLSPGPVPTTTSTHRSIVGFRARLLGVLRYRSSTSGHDHPARVRSLTPADRHPPGHGYLGRLLEPRTSTSAGHPDLRAAPADLPRRKRIIIPVPVLTLNLSALWIDLITRCPPPSPCR